ncbi:MAG: metalloregulator ArsR/SmtB family transcription factor [Roseiflexaceae bacterium]
MNQPANRFRAEFFKALGHPARIVILEALRHDERNVTQLQEIPNLEQSNVSRQLAILRSRGIVEDRKEGTTVFYRVRDPLVVQLLDLAKTIFNSHLIGTQEMLQQLADEGVAEALK